MSRATKIQENFGNWLIVPTGVVHRLRSDWTVPLSRLTNSEEAISLMFTELTGIDGNQQEAPLFDRAVEYAYYKYVEHSSMMALLLLGGMCKDFRCKRVRE